mmetsp:Transcript_24950/g.78642  ORF Transcript_24950/g.78642 Transcript_24950/m.78642 type:complete len:203 (+) Transcript_24950:303-911(+)
MCRSSVCSVWPMITKWFIESSPLSASTASASSCLSMPSRSRRLGQAPNTIFRTSGVSRPFSAGQTWKSFSCTSSFVRASAKLLLVTSRRWFTPSMPTKADACSKSSLSVCVVRRSAALCCMTPGMPAASMAPEVLGCLLSLASSCSSSSSSEASEEGVFIQDSTSSPPSPACALFISVFRLMTFWMSVARATFMRIRFVPRT